MKHYSHRILSPFWGKIIVTFLIVIMSIGICRAQYAGLKIHYLGANHSLVQVQEPQKYLLLPVEEAAPEATVNVLVNNKADQSFQVRLAVNRIDYLVPFALEQYKGKTVTFDIHTGNSRTNVRDAMADACWKELKLSDTFDDANREAFRPFYHHTPVYGWMNDPNGMFYKDGEYHLYYQYNPYGSMWGNMNWGHSSSKDLISWQHHPVAIQPNGLGAVFSGSSVVDKDNTAGFGKEAVVALYTSAGTSQVQSLAYSRDNGATFTKFPGNPVLTLESEARDPNMFWNTESGEWNLVLAHPLDHEMLFFTSPDLKTWTMQSAFGKGEGEQGGVWECPDLFPVAVDGTGEKKWVLICNINPGGPFGGSAIQYFIGDWDGKTFNADTDAEGRIPTKWLDYGKDNYALVSWSGAPDGRRTAIGWMSNWQYAAEVPTMQYRSANTLPREIGLFRGPDGQIYASSTPSPELLALRNRLVTSKSGTTLGGSAKSFRLPESNSGVCEILAEIATQSADSVTLTLSNKVGEKVEMVYDPVAHTMKFDRRRSGVTDFSESFPAVTAAPTFETDGKLSLRIFIDRSSIEYFGNEGRSVMTNIVFPTEPYTTLSFTAAGGKAKLKNLKIYSLTAK